MRSQVRTIGCCLGLIAALVLVATPADAVDGVIEINQARALAGGVTPGDEAGFPVRVTQGGSYRLTGNLTVPDANTTAIEITVSDVTIDLNGFAILGPTVCTGVPATCTGGGTGIGISALSNATNTTVLNGTVRGMGNRGLDLSARSRVQGLRALGNGTEGIAASTGSTVSGNTAIANGRDGILTGGGGLLSGNTARENGRRGISGDGPVTGNTANNNGDVGINAGVASTVSGNTANNNVGAGIVAGFGSTVSGNAARANGGFGLSLTPNLSGYVGNVLLQNNSGGAQVTGGIQMGPNVCDGALCP